MQSTKTLSTVFSMRLVAKWTTLSPLPSTLWVVVVMEVVDEVRAKEAIQLSAIAVVALAISSPSALPRSTRMAMSSLMPHQPLHQRRKKLHRRRSPLQYLRVLQCLMA